MISTALTPELCAGIETLLPSTPPLPGGEIVTRAIFVDAFFSKRVREKGYEQVRAVLEERGSEV